MAREESGIDAGSVIHISSLAGPAYAQTYGLDAALEIPAFRFGKTSTSDVDLTYKNRNEMLLQMLLTSEVDSF